MSLDWIFWGNTLRAWLLAVLVALAAYAALRFIRSRVMRQFLAISQRTQTGIDDITYEVLEKTRSFFLIFVSLYAGSRVLALGPTVGRAIQIIAVVVITIQAAYWGEATIRAVMSRRIRETLGTDAASVTTLHAIGFLSRLVLWTTLLLLALANLGVKIVPLLAGLGVGGIAVALAVQNVLGDLFASLAIVLDKPFVVGDFITVGDMMGTVERVGLKTTRVRSLSGEQLIFANADLLNARIRNYKRMVERRVMFRVGVTYQTPYDKLTAIPSMVREHIEAQSGARFDRCHFQGYGASTLDIEIVYYVLDADYTRYMDIQQAINLAIYKRFAEEGIEFAYPTQTVFLER